MKIFTDLIDKLIFTGSFLIGIQLPAFLHAYVQHLQGRLSEAELELNGFQNIADKQFSGDIQQLIQHFIKNSDEAFRSTGRVITELVHRVEDYQLQINALTEASYVNNIASFMLHFDKHIVSATFDHFVPNIPLGLHSLVTGLVAALFFSLLFNGCCFTCRLAFYRHNSQADTVK